ncbi:MAG: helix-turn-helix domain-containing protein, partial [Beijerinckiaceae bacterium]|nr:helix-turn-helix domain-containing protein [Beijerinckiaceae bacterium]
MTPPKTRRAMPEKRTTKPTADADTQVSVRRGIQSVEIGFRVLAALAEDTQPSTLGAVATRAGLSASQTHRYLSSLIASGMARQVSSTGRYDLGSQAIQVGLAALARTDVFAEADPAIAEFTRETGRTTLVAALGP